MNRSVGYRSQTITSDRTGGWTNKGCEFEDFFEADEAFFEIRKEREVKSQPSLTGRIQPMHESVGLHRVADTIIEAFVAALDQTVLRGWPPKRELYIALTDALQGRMWRDDFLPTAAMRSPSSSGLAWDISQSDSNLEDQLAMSYKHESQAVTNAFKNIAQGFRPDRKSEKPQYFDGIAE